MPYLAAVRRSVTVFCSDVKLPGILTALLASALITFSGEQAASTEKWTAPAAEARLGASLSNFGSVNPLQDPTLDPTILPATRLPLTTSGRPRQMRTKFQSPSNPPIRTNQRSWPLFCLGQIQATGLAPPNGHEAAILTTLPTGNFGDRFW